MSRVFFSALLVVFMLFGIQSTTGGELTSRCKLSLRGDFFPNKGSNEERNTNWILELEPEFFWFLEDIDTEIVFNPRGSINLSDTEQNFFNKGDMYLEYRGEHFEARIGSMLLFAGSVESEHLVDIFNQKNYEFDFIDAKKIGEVGGRLRWLWQETILDLIVFPKFTIAPMPGYGNRYNLFPSMKGFGDTNLFSNSKEEDLSQFGIRLSYSAGGADIGVTYFQGYNKFPSIFVNAASSQITTFYYEQELIGLDLQWALEKWLLKMEAVYRDTHQAGQQYIDGIVEGQVIKQKMIPKSDFAFVGGVEYTFMSFWNNCDLGIIAEYMYDSIRMPDPQFFLPYTNELFTGFRFEFNDADNSSIKTGLFYDLNDSTTVFRLEAVSLLTDYLQIGIRYDDIQADNDNQLHVFKDDDRLSLMFTYFY